MKKNRYAYTIHNIIAHPLMEVFHLLGMPKIGNKIHDMTLPKIHQFEHQPINQPVENKNPTAR